MARDDFSRALRVIGQILDEQRIDLFDLRCFGNDFYLLCGDPMPPHLNLVELRYSAAEIEALDRAAREKRQEANQFVNLDGLPEILRALGHRVDVFSGRLLRVNNSEFSTAFDSIKIEYQTRDGRHHAEEFSTGAVCEQAIRMYKERSRRAGTPAWQ
ncbi:MAG TPA: hypothetical protein VH985_07095 [Candidatus Binatia bacterium]|jgi:hypothetical protein